MGVVFVGIGLKGLVGEWVRKGEKVCLCYVNKRERGKKQRRGREKSNCGLLRCFTLFFFKFFFK